MALALQAEERVPAVGNQRIDLIAGRQRRLMIALSFFPENSLPQTRLLARGATQEVTSSTVEAAAVELAEAALKLAPASFGPLSGPD
jgi:hypothetical protein